VRYPKYSGFAGFLSMALFRLPLMLNKKISFWKLLGCGKNGTFDIHPDWNQWAVFMVNGEWSMVNKNNANNYKLQTINYKLTYGSFINWWWKFFKCEVYSIILEPLEGHGTWDGKKILGELSTQKNHEGIIAVLTRATIRLKRLKNFWKHVDGVAVQTQSAPGFITSVGIGEMPWIKQATFSVWESKEAMKAFAYKTQHHTEVIQKTRNENWYSEEMFIRFKLIASFGSLNGNDPLKGKL
jgi:hypothetical protein